MSYNSANSIQKCSPPASGGGAFRCADRTYCYPFLTRSIYSDPFLQGTVSRCYERLMQQIRQASPDSLKIPYSPLGASRMLRQLIKTDPDVRLVLISSDGVKIKLKADKQIDPQPNLSPVQVLIAPASELAQTSSRLVRFIGCTNNRFKIDANYVNKLLEITQLIYQGLNEGRERVKVHALGYDRLFIKRALMALFPNEVRLILPQCGEMGEEVHIAFKRHSDVPLDQHLEHIQSIESLLKADAEEIAAAAQMSSSPSCSPSFPAFQIPAERDYEYAFSYLMAYFSYRFINTEMKDPSQLNNSEVTREWLTELRIDPYLLQTLKHSLQELIVSRQSSFSTTQFQAIQHMQQCTSLQGMLETYGTLDGSTQTTVRDAWGGTHALFFLQEIAKLQIHKSLVSLTVLKLKAEASICASDERMPLAAIDGISIEQTCRAFFPSDSDCSQPLVDVSVNGKKIDPRFNSAIPLELLRNSYFQDILSHLYCQAFPEYAKRAALGTGADNLTYFNPSIFKHLSKGILAHSESDSVLSSSEKALIRMLKAGTFSAYAHGNTLLQSEQFIKLPPDLKLKYLTSQEGPTVEYTIASPERFAVIRNGEYSLMKGEQTVGLVVMKYTAFFDEEGFVQRLQFPLIYLNPDLAIEEQEAIYRAFGPPSQG